MAKSGLQHADVGDELSKAEWLSEESHQLVHGTSFPGSPVERQLFYRDDEHIWYVYNGSSWVSLQAGGGSVDYLNDIGDVNVPTPSDDDLLYWDATASQWQCRALVDADIPSSICRDDEADSKISSHAADKDAHHSNILTLTFIIDGGGSAITTGEKGHLRIPFACTINRVTMMADQTGSIVVDIWKDNYANFPPTDADSITASAPPTISTAQKSEDSTLTGWTTSISADDILAFNVDSCSTIERVTISLKVTKS